MSLRLLGGHVLGSAGDDATLGQTGVIHGAGQAKISQPDTADAVLQEDICRLHITMHQTLCMRRRQSGRCLHADTQDVFDFHRPVAVETFLKRTPRDVRHDQVRQPLPGIDGVDGDDVRMDDGGGRLGFAVEPFACRAAAGKIRSQHLDRDGPIQGGIEDPEDHAHAAAAENIGDGKTVQPAQMCWIIRRIEKVESERAAFRVGRRLRTIDRRCRWAAVRHGHAALALVPIV